MFETSVFETIFTISFSCSLTGHISPAKVGGVSYSLGSSPSLELHSALYNVIDNHLTTHSKPGPRYMNKTIATPYVLLGPNNISYSSDSQCTAIGYRKFNILPIPHPSETFLAQLKRKT